METATNIFEVLTAIATLTVIVFAGIVLAYVIVVLRLVHELLERIGRLLNSFADGATETIESVKDHRKGLLGLVGLISGYLIARNRKKKK